MAVTVHEKVAAVLGEAFGPRMVAVYATKLKEGERADLREVSIAFLLDLAQRTAEEDIDPSFTLPLTWPQFYARQPEWEWPEYD